MDAIYRLLIGLRPVSYVLLTLIFGLAELVFGLVRQVGRDVCSEFRRRLLSLFVCRQQPVVLADALVKRLLLSQVLRVMRWVLLPECLLVSFDRLASLVHQQVLIEVLRVFNRLWTANYGPYGTPDHHPLSKLLLVV